MIEAGAMIGEEPTMITEVAMIDGTTIGARPQVTSEAVAETEAAAGEVMPAA
jgi:hypothetical protein